jgi:hypothetical protein
MYDSIWDRLAAWLAQFSALQQLGIIAAVMAALWGCVVWITL